MPVDLMAGPLCTWDAEEPLLYVWLISRFVKSSLGLRYDVIV
jgi:hypothetical protein